MKNIYLQIPLNTPDIYDWFLQPLPVLKDRHLRNREVQPCLISNGLLAGTIGGGVLEGKVQEIARQALQSKEPVLYHFRLDNSVSNGEDALCGGKISVLIDPFLSGYIPLFKEIRKSAEERVPGILMTTGYKS